MISPSPIASPTFWVKAVASMIKIGSSDAEALFQVTAIPNINKNNGKSLTEAEKIATELDNG